jgi:hypothetical protein
VTQIGGGVPVLPCPNAKDKAVTNLAGMWPLACCCMIFVGVIIARTEDRAAIDPPLQIQWAVWTRLLGFPFLQICTQTITEYVRVNHDLQCTKGCSQ